MTNFVILSLFFSISAIEAQTSENPVSDLASGNFDKSKHFEPKELDKLCAVFYQICMHILTNYNDNEQLTNYAEANIAEFMTVFEHSTDAEKNGVNSKLEIELLYATECIYSKFKQENKAGKINLVMQELWDSYSFSKTTIIEKWKSDRNGVDRFRGMESFDKIIFVWKLE